MKSQILLKHPGTIDQYPYARYAYECITQFFQENGGQTVLVPSGKFIPEAPGVPTLWVIDMPVCSGFSGRWWQTARLSRLLKKIDASLMIILGWDLTVLPKLRTACWLIIPEIHGLISTDKPSRQVLARRAALSRHLGHAQQAFIYAPDIKATLQEMMGPALTAKLQTWVPYPQSDQGPLSWEEKESIKEMHTSGQEYFLIDAASADQEILIHYLKAFSHFKKWQKSGMKLVLLISDEQLENKSLQELIGTFHFRADVELQPAADRSIRYVLFAAAYAVIEPTGKGGHLVHLLETAQYGSLAVAIPSVSVTEILGDALFALPGTGFQEIGQTMITIYKSEILRARHIKASEILASTFQPRGWSYWLQRNRE